CFGSRNNQKKKRNTKKVPPPISRTGADVSAASINAGLELTVMISRKLRFGLLLHRMRIGRRPLTRKTAMMIPHVRNHFRDFADIVERTSELIMALSRLFTTSKILKPTTISRDSRIQAEPSTVGTVAASNRVPKMRQQCR